MLIHLNVFSSSIMRFDNEVSVNLVQATLSMSLVSCLLVQASARLS